MGVIFRQGGTIGSSALPQNSTANGVWPLGSLYFYNAINQWPVQIVKNGLQMNMDAAIVESYPGSGSAWNDLSGNNRNSALSNSPSYSSANGGFFTFNGTNQQAYGPDANIGTNSFTLDIWARPTATITVNAQSTSGTAGLTGQKYLLFPALPANFNTEAGAGISLGTNGISVYEHGNGYLPPLLSHTVSISSTIFSHVVIVYTNKLPSLYINDVFIKNGLTSTKTNVYYNPGTFIGGAYGLFSGAVSSVKIYNRSLSVSEISQNFNALRNRYGL